MQFVVFEKFTSAYLFQIAREKSFDYLLVKYMQKFESDSFSSVVVRLLALFGRLPLPCCRSSLAFPSRTCFELLNSLSRMIECLYSLSPRYRSRDSSNHYTKAIRFVIIPVFLTNCCVKLLKDFVQGLWFVLFNAFVISLLRSPRLPDFYPVICAL